MFDVAPTELIVLGTVALMVIPPKDLPKAMRVAGYWVGRARGVARQFRSGFDNIIRESELAEMEQRWKADNERIMREHPANPAVENDPATGGFDAALVMVAQPTIAHVPGSQDELASAERPVAVEAPVVEPAAAATPSAADGKALS